jgi:UDP-2,3-diacylglucosamine pyrophosphatase LpxH
MADAVILSDLHLGSDTCQARLLAEFLEPWLDAHRRPDRLILNGDVFDSIDFRRLGKHHWKVLSLLRKLSDRMEIVWVTGNHDGPAEIVSHLLGVAVRDEYVLTSGGRRILILHGHTFDDFLDRHPVLTWVADVIYWVLQRIDNTHTVARFAKRSSKTFIRCAKKIEEGSLEYARKKDCDAVCCGHTHQAVAPPGGQGWYYNSGCWTELPCTYLTVEGGRVELHRFAPVPAPADEVLAPV